MSDDTTKSWPTSVEEWPSDIHGCKGCMYFTGHEVAIEAWGERANERDTCATAFAYLWRRFGPPPIGSDPHKDLCTYILTTPMDGLYAWINLSASTVSYSIGFLAKMSLAIDEQVYKPQSEWEEKFQTWFIDNGGEQTPNDFWMARTNEETINKAAAAIGPCPRRQSEAEARASVPIVAEMHNAIIETLRDLLRPVFVRDVAINLFGHVKDEDISNDASYSDLAGYGVPLAEMRRLRDEDK